MSIIGWYHILCEDCQVISDHLPVEVEEEEAVLK